ncbi:DUF262 domain-containing protein [Helicobacter sp. MIT 01-3238]|uniref:GmrSD restriction endonuclease domain-containing protein n=1 Tax=Helicobacter sp. MIT 01-3238 TaxID=398627 RepID=UPI00216242C9|nr:DUF262 domain-containing protein [Helicobacter sp. MIT 01-3238]
MSNQNKAQKQMIVDIKDIFFEIPPYQRLYEWGKDEIETLLDDMKKAYDESKEQYFIGNITTSKKSENEGEKFILIDGQQRLTTLWFIGFYLASREYEWEKEITKKVWQEFILKGDKLRIAMPIRDKEREALENLAKKIQKSEIKPNKEKKLELSKDLQGIHQKIIDAFYYIELWFNGNFSKDDNKKEIDSKRLNCFANFIYTKICFVFVELAQNTDLNRFFVRMNNRGKQLEQHEILKARILSVIQQGGGGEWQKYAKIWDLCSDMNKYIFQSASDRNFLNSENESGEKWGIDTIISEFNERNAKNAQNDDTPDKVESIIDFPTFLLHCYKLYSQDNSVSITQDKLLEIFNLSKMDSESCKWFIIDMLYYRVLFDYFVIKNNAEQGNGFRIRRLYPYKDKNQKTYYRLPEDSKLVADRPLHNLAMIQNYLRVARQGDRQNYHHWLTPFLQKLFYAVGTYDNFVKYFVDKGIIAIKNDKNGKWESQVQKSNPIWNPNQICAHFAGDYDEGKQDNLVKFLEILDTNLAIAQLSDKELLNETNEAIKEAQKYHAETPANIDFNSLLNNGTGTPHYWFYRLEYYLWKNGVENEETLKIKDKNFSAIRKNFYFRNLGSIEHFQPQSEPDEKWWLNDKSEMDTFGNLALISRSLNSSLGKQNLDKKEIDIAKEGNSESLKLVLMCCLKNLKNNDIKANEEISKAQAHQEQMLGILIKSLKSSQ